MNYIYLLTSTTDTATTTGSSWTFIIMMAVLFVAMYFFMIRPQRKQEKETAQMRNSLQIGDEITTVGGIIGKIVSIKEETCMIETGRDRTRIRIMKWAIKSVDVPAAVANGVVSTEAPKAEIPAESEEPKKEEKEKKGLFGKKK